MIDLTPLEVRQKKDDFPRGLRGYDPGHVDDFLDLVADRLEALVKENRRLAEELESVRASAGEYRDREKALTEALVSAQQMRETVREQTSKEAELVRREAEQEAQRLRSDAVRAIEREEETLRRLRARQRQLVEGYRGMLERELRELAVVAESLDSSEASPAPAVVADAAEGGDADDGLPAAGSGAARAAASAAGSAGPSGAATGGASAAARQDAPGAASRAAPDAAPKAGTTDAAPPASREAPAKPAEAGRVMDEEEGRSDRDTDGWTPPPPASAPRPEADRRGHGRDRFASPAAALEADRSRPAEPAADAGKEEGEGGRSRGEEPDWLAAILKEE